MTRGTVARIENHGTIVTVWVQAKTRLVPLHYDHRMFQHMVDGRDGVDNIIGQEVTIRDEPEALVFEEAA